MAEKDKVNQKIMEKILISIHWFKFYDTVEVCFFQWK